MPKFREKNSKKTSGQTNRRTDEPYFIVPFWLLPKETKKKLGVLRIMIVRTKKSITSFKYEISDFQNKEFVIYQPKQRFFYSWPKIYEPKVIENIKQEIILQ